MQPLFDAKGQITVVYENALTARGIVLVRRGPGGWKTFERNFSAISKPLRLKPKDKTAGLRYGGVIGDRF